VRPTPSRYDTDGLPMVRRRRPDIFVDIGPTLGRRSLVVWVRVGFRLKTNVLFTFVSRL